MSAPTDSLVVRLLRGLSSRVIRFPGWFIWPQLVLFAACVWYTVANLEFVMDRNALLDANLAYNQNFLRYRNEFPAQADLVAVVESEDPEKNRQFVERLAVRLEAESTAASPTNLFTDVFYKGDLTLMGKKALLFVPETNLVELNRTLKEYRPFLQQFASSSNLSSLFGQINTLIRTSPQQTNSETDSLINSLPALQRIIRRAQESLNRPGTPPSPGVEALFGGGREAESRKYLTFGRGRIYLTTARPRAILAEEAVPPSPSFWSRITGRDPTSPEALKKRRKSLQEDLNARAVSRFRELVLEVQAEVGGVNAGVTGEGVLDFDEMVQSQKDSTMATTLSLALVALIFVFGYRQMVRPLLATGCLVFGLGYTMAFTTATVGHLNILTITFVPMLIGLAIDFGVHLITRFEEELANGLTKNEAMELAMVNTGKGIFTGCLTTAGAFAAMSITDFRGIREMGVICGGGLVICLIPMMTLLPALLLGRKSARAALSPVAKAPTNEAPDLRARIERIWLERPWTVLGLAGALSAVTAAGAFRVHFDYNLLNMQSPQLASVQFEHKLVDSAEKSVIFGAVIATNLAEAQLLEERLRALPTVGSVESMASFLAADSTTKLGLIQGIRETAAPIQFAEPDSRPVDLNDLSQTLWSLQGYLALAADEVALRGRTNLLNDIVSLKNALGEFRTELFRGTPQERERHARKLAAFQYALLSDLRDTINTLRTQDNTGGLRPIDLPDPLRNRFVGVQSNLLLQVYPRTNVWDREPQQAFVAELHSVEPTATGAPVQMYFYTELLKQSYVEAAWWALAAIVILVWIHFRRFSSVVLSLIPVGLGTLWIVGIMGWVGVPFNPANIMMLPLVIGIGITNGIHILNRFAEEKNPSILAKSTGKAVFVSGLTTVAGFGSLVLAEHQGIRSLGFIMAFGTATCMTAGLTVLPALLTVGERKPPAAS
ncbi:MAG: MMPL family transporter [Verrucomicrobia bacterium]|nr:MMPL family transporter [Verrucomicrobiota bacterium]